MCLALGSDTCSLEDRWPCLFIQSWDVCLALGSDICSLEDRSFIFSHLFIKYVSSSGIRQVRQSRWLHLGTGCCMCNVFNRQHLSCQPVTRAEALTKLWQHEARIACSHLSGNVKSFTPHTCLSGIWHAHDAELLLLILLLLLLVFFLFLLLFSIMPASS